MFLSSECLRDTAVGQVIRYISNARYLQYPEETADFQLPRPYDLRATEVGNTSSEDILNTSIGDACEKTQSHVPESGLDLERGATATIAPQKTADGALVVGWYTEDDPANPLNWSRWRKAYVHAAINYYAFSIYMASSIYTPAAPELVHIFGISPTVSSLGLGIFVLGYGIGPLVFGPLSEIPSIGRIPIYVVTELVFLVLSILTALAGNIPGFMVLRFLQGFFGAPALCIAGGTIGDITQTLWLPFMLYMYAFCPLAGPSLGPLIAGFSIPAEGWRWSMWEIVWSVAASFMMMIFLPETSASTILFRRAARLRALTENENYLSRSEVNDKQLSVALIAKNSLLVPWKVNALDPSVLFTSLYCALVYAIFYSFFEVFPLVYMDMYGMNAGEMGMVFLAVLIAVVVGGVPYLAFIHFVVNKATIQEKVVQPEVRLIPAVVSSFLMPVGVFLFAWTSNPNIHWLVPTIGVFLCGGAVCIIIQSVFVYIALAYPSYVSSLFAANTFCRAVLALAAVLWSQPLYRNLGVARGTSILGALCTGCIIGVVVLWRWGGRLRRRSRFAVSH